MKLMELIGKKKGFSVIEYLVALTVLLIVIGLGIIFNFYVLRSFNIASKQHMVQQNVRLVKDIIEDKIRFSKIQLLDELPDNQREGYQIIYADGGIVKYIDKFKNKKNLLDSTISDDVDMSLYFEKVGDHFLRIRVQGDIDGEHMYKIDYEMMIHKVTGDENIIEGDNGSIIYFYSPGG